ncbi:MAG: hypothetical protein HY060_26535 [Proteobacteria bacterium]|nr:hypothetical protein [Pseudomonadota bacterium]
MSRVRTLLWRYLAIVAGTVVVLAGLCLGANALVDPLWYFGGNVITGVNFPFNERLAKINRLLPRTAQFDCLMLGSSTTALTPEAKIDGHRCFNMGFSAGVVSELLVYGKYLRARGFAPKLLIVGVDSFDYEGPTLTPDVPDFMKRGEAPPSFWHSYLSLDALDFSYRTLRYDYPHRRWFDREWRSHIIPRRRAYRAPAKLEPQVPPPEMHAERAELYVELRRLFPEARAIAFVAPTAAWTIAQLKLDGNLDAYLDGLKRTAPAFDTFLDFSIPSEITVSITNTFDGLHYFDEINDLVAAALMSGKPAPGVDWKHEAPAAIKAAYEERIDRLVLKPLAAKR